MIFFLHNDSKIFNSVLIVSYVRVENPHIKVRIVSTFVVGLVRDTEKVLGPHKEVRRKTPLREVFVRTRQD